MQVRAFERYIPLSYHLSLRSLFLSNFEWPFYTDFTVLTEVNGH